VACQAGLVLAEFQSSKPHILAVSEIVEEFPEGAEVAFLDVGRQTTGLEFGVDQFDGGHCRDALRAGCGGKPVHSTKRKGVELHPPAALLHGLDVTHKCSREVVVDG